MISLDEVNYTGPGAIALGTTLFSTPSTPSSGVMFDHSTAGTLKLRNFANSADAIFTCSALTASGALSGTTASYSGSLIIASATAISSSVTAVTQNFFTGSTATNFGLFFCQGAPSFAAAIGSICMRSDGSSTSTRLYVAQTSAGTWTGVTTAA
jgi:hypothetical protein